MLGKQPLIILFLFVATVFLLRKPHQQSFSFSSRQLQDATDENIENVEEEDTYIPTFAANVSKKLCGSYAYRAPTLDRQQEAYDISEDISKFRDSNTFKDLINKGEIQDGLIDEYLSNFLPFFLALGIPFVVCTAVFILCVINWSCMCCPSCSVLRCGICDRPSTKSSINCYAVMSLVFSLFVLGAGIAGVVYFTDITPKVDGTVCQATFMMEEMYDGKDSGNWFGINPLKNMLETIQSNLVSANRMLRQVETNFTRLQRDIDNISGNFRTIENGFKNDTITRANFMEELSYTPEFVNTLRDQMTLAYESVDYFNSNLTEARDLFDSSMNEFTGQKDTVLSAVDSGARQARGIATDLQSSLAWLDDNGEFIHDFVKGLSLAIKICLAVIIGFTGFSFLSALISFWSKYKHFNKCVHLAWFVIGAFTVVAWIAATILFPATVACVEACQVIDGVITNATFANMSLNSIFGTKQSSLKDAMIVCLHGSGAIIDNFAIKDQMDLFPIINQGLKDAASQLDENSLPSDVDTSELKSLLNRIATNQVPDDAKTEIDLITLNNYIYLNFTTQTRCADVYDQWVLNNERCEQLNLNPILQENDPDNYQLGSNLCIPLASWREPDTRDIANRYSPDIFANCARVINPNGERYRRDDYLQTVVKRFMRNRRDLVSLIDDINGYVDDVDNQATQLLVNAKGAMREPFNVVQNFANDIQQLVFDPNTGLLYNTECTFVRERMDHLNNELCVNLIPTIYNTAIALIVGSSLASLLTLFLFCMARKLISKQVEYNQNKTYPQ